MTSKRTSSTAFAPIQAGERLSVTVADRLAQQIRQGDMPGGTKLPTEASLAAQFQVSRTVIREAVARLKSLGMVDSRQGSGVYVLASSGFAPLNFEPQHAASREAVLQIVEIRRALEAECASLAAERRSSADVRDLRAALAAIEKAVSAGHDGVEEDVLFHRAIARAAGNPFLISTLDYLAQFLRHGTRVTRANEARNRVFAQQVHAEHLAIAEAIAQADPAKARRAAVRHMKNAARRIEQADEGFWAQEGHKLASQLLKTKLRVP